MSVIPLLRTLKIDEDYYLNKCRERAKKHGLNYHTLELSNCKNKKLSIRNDDGKKINFGSATNKDFIIWSILEFRGDVEKGYAWKKQNVFHKSHEAMHYDKDNKYSPNALSLAILW
jgi:hypothetical protein